MANKLIVAPAPHVQTAQSTTRKTTRTAKKK